MKTLLLRWVAVVLAVLLVGWGLPQLDVMTEPLLSYNDNWTTLAIFAAALALLNTFVRPILVLLSLPITCLTAGLFTIVINVGMFALAAWLVEDFDASFWGAVIGAIAVSIVGAVVNMVAGED